MKKILGISLVAMMAVTTARAEIASKAYVDTNFQGKALVTTVTNASDDTHYPSAKAVYDFVDTQVSTAGGNYDVAGAAQAVADKMVTATSNFGDDANSTSKYPSMATAQAIAAAAVDGASSSYATAAQGATAETTAAAVNNATTGLAATKEIADANATAIASINNPTTGILATAEGYTNTAISNLSLGTTYVPQTRTVNGEALSGNVTLDGSDLALTGYEKAESAAAVAATDTINQAFGKVQKTLEGKQDAIAAGTYVATVTTNGSGNVITGVSANTNGTVTVSTGNAILETSTINSSGGADKYVLTASVDANGATNYAWELIQRNGENQ